MSFYKRLVQKAREANGTEDGWFERVQREDDLWRARHTSCSFCKLRIYGPNLWGVYCWQCKADVDRYTLQEYRRKNRYDEGGVIMMGPNGCPSFEIDYDKAFEYDDKYGG